MAEYYAVLSRAVAGLEANSPDTRRAVYDKARNALIGQLKAIDPPLPTSEISRQRLELEEAIRRVERETSSVPAGAPVRVSASRPAAAEPPPPPSSRAAPAPPRQSPQDVFRRAIQDAEHREATEEPRLERAPVAARIDTSWASERIDRVPPPARPAQSYLPSQGYVEEQPAAADEPRLAPDYDYAWDQNSASPEGEEHAPPPSLRADDRERLGPKPRRAAKRAAPRTDDHDDHDEIERTARPSRLPMIVLIVLILAMVGALSALGWSQRDVIADLAGGFIAADSGARDAPPAAPAADVAADASGKDTDRLLVGGEPAPAGDVRVVAPEGTAEGDPLAAQVASTEALPLQSTAEDAPAADAIDADALVAQRAALFEEPAEAGADVFPISAAVTWSYVESGPNGPEILGTVDIPERGMTFKIAIRRNIDETLPASHIVEVVVNAPADRAVREIPRLVFKPSEDSRGQPLIGAPAQVADGFFWIVLSSVQSDVNANVNLLKDRLWIDLPFVYANGQRAILTFEKGTPGERVFERALTAWAG